MEIEHGETSLSRRKNAGPKDPAVSLIAESPGQIKGAIFMPVRPLRLSPYQIIHGVQF
jgi:hypothetical protein